MPDFEADSKITELDDYMIYHTFEAAVDSGYIAAEKAIEVLE